MRRVNLVSSISVLVLLTAVFGSALNIPTVKGGGTIYIRADGSIDPQTAPIQQDGNIYMFTNNIYDSVVVERDNIIIDGAGYTLQGISVPGSRGLYLYIISNVTIINMAIKAFSYSIFLDSSSDNIIYGNNMTNNGIGIFLLQSSNNSIFENNIAANNVYGVYLRSSFNNTVSRNIFLGDGLVLDSSYDNTVLDNSVNGKPLVYLEGVSDVAIEDAGQVILVKCNRIRVENLNLSNADVALQLWDTDNTTVTRNNITKNEEGIFLFQTSKYNIISGNNITNNGVSVYLDSSSNNIISENNVTNNSIALGLFYSDYTTISGNNITNNTDGIDFGYSSHTTVSGNNITKNDVGMSLFGSSSSSISGNSIKDNEYGIFLFESSSNSFLHNNFVNNAQQVFTLNSVNVWDSGYPSGGNYWTDYNSTDFYNGPFQNQAGSDGIGDTPYSIDENNNDRYPLIYPYGYIPNPDLNGDRHVDGKDIALAAKAFGSYPSHPRWNFRTDINQNSRIEGKDIAKIAKNFGTYDPQLSS